MGSWDSSSSSVVMCKCLKKCRTSGRESRESPIKPIKDKGIPGPESWIDLLPVNRYTLCSLMNGIENDPVLSYPSLCTFSITFIVS